MAAKTPEARSEAARKASPTRKARKLAEQSIQTRRSEAARKAWVTRRRVAAEQETLAWVES